MVARQPRGLRRLTPWAVVASVAVPVSAAEWAVTPEVRNTLVYDDNRRLSVADHDGVWGDLLDAGVALGFRTPRLEATVTPRFELHRFSGERDLLNREDRYLDGVVSHIGERSRLEINAALGYRGSLTNDLEADEQTNVNSDTRERAVTATWSYALTPRNTLQVSGSYSDIDFDLDRTTGLTDYRVASVSVTGVHQLGARDQLSLTLFQTRFNSPEATTEINGVATTAESLTTTTGFQLGWNRTLSETLTGSVSIGSRDSQTESTTRQSTVNGVTFAPAGGRVQIVASGQGGDLTGDVVSVPQSSTLVVPPFQVPATLFNPGDTIAATVVAIPAGEEVLLIAQDIDESNQGLALNVSLNQRLERWSWQVDYSRSLSPQSNGALRERDNVQWSLRRRVSSRLTGLVDGRYYEDGGLDDGAGDDQRTFFRFSSGLRWQVSPYWALTGRYQHRRNENPNTDAAESNAVLFTLAYSGDKTAWSR